LGSSGKILDAYKEGLVDMTYKTKKTHLSKGLMGLAGGTVLAGGTAYNYLKKDKKGKIEKKAALSGVELAAGIPTVAYTATRLNYDKDTSSMAAGGASLGAAYGIDYKLRKGKMDRKSNRIALLTGSESSGAGHGRQAKAMKGALEGKGYEVDLIDSKSVRRSFLQNEDQKALFRSINKFDSPSGRIATEDHMWKSTRWNKDPKEGLQGSGLLNKLKRSWEGVKDGTRRGYQNIAMGDYNLGKKLDKDYKAIINTLPSGDTGLEGTRLKSITAPTDYGIAERLWGSKSSEGNIVPSDNTNFDPKKTYNIGTLPLDKHHVNAVNDKAKAIEDNYKLVKDNADDVGELKNLSKNKKWIMVSGGGTGVGVEHSTEALNKWMDNDPTRKDKYQVVSFAGPSNADLDKHLKKKYKGNKNVVTLSKGYFPSTMRSSDIIVARPGGATTNELKVHGKPVIQTFSHKPTVETTLKTKGKNHEFKNYEYLKDKIDAKLMFSDDMDSVNSAMDSAINNEKAIKTKAENYAKETRAIDYPEELDKSIKALTKGMKSESRLKLLPQSAPAKALGVVGAGLTAGGALAKYNKNKKSKKGKK